MLFRKKKPADETPAAPSAPDRRGQYRVSARAEYPILAGVERYDGTLLEGGCLDLSIGGAWVQLEAAPTPELVENEVCALRIRAALLPPIRATCRVVALRPGKDGSLRIGLEFTHRIELYAQLDEGYAELFNRRRHVRVKTDHSHRVPVRISWRSGSFPGMALDIAEGGLGMVVPEARAKELERIEKVELSFCLPEDDAEIVCAATIQSRSRWRAEILLGIAFTPGGGIEAHAERVQLCVEKRLAEFRAWNEGPGKKLRSKRAS